MQRGAAYFALFLVGMVLVKDGTIQTLARDLGNGLADFGKGVRPLTNVA